MKIEIDRILRLSENYLCVLDSFVESDIGSSERASYDAMLDGMEITLGILTDVNIDIIHELADKIYESDHNKPSRDRRITTN